MLMAWTVDLACVAMTLMWWSRFLSSNPRFRVLALAVRPRDIPLSVLRAPTRLRCTSFIPHTRSLSLSRPSPSLCCILNFRHVDYESIVSRRYWCAPLRLKGLSFHIPCIVHGPLQVRSQFRPYFCWRRLLLYLGLIKPTFRMFPWFRFVLNVPLSIPAFPRLP